MVRLTRKPGAKSRPRWYSSHVPHSNATLDSDIRKGVFYVPVSENEEALDSFIVLDGILYIFQFTIAGNHFIKPGFLMLFGKCRGVPPKEKWRFVFVIPHGLTMSCPEPKSPLNELHPYSAMVSVPCRGKEQIYISFLYQRLVLPSVTENLDPSHLSLDLQVAVCMAREARKVKRACKSGSPTSFALSTKPRPGLWRTAGQQNGVWAFMKGEMNLTSIRHKGRGVNVPSNSIF